MSPRPCFRSLSTPPNLLSFYIRTKFRSTTKCPICDCFSCGCGGNNVQIWVGVSQLRRFCVIAGVKTTKMTERAGLRQFDLEKSFTDHMCVRMFPAFRGALGSLLCLSGMYHPACMDCLSSPSSTPRYAANPSLRDQMKVATRDDRKRRRLLGANGSVVELSSFSPLIPSRPLLSRRSFPPYRRILRGRIEGPATFIDSLLRRRGTLPPTTINPGWRAPRRLLVTS
jgi:hypothetical protein